ATRETTPQGSHALDEERRAIWRETIDDMAQQGLRVIGIAWRALDTVPETLTPEIERDLSLLALVGIVDPARPEARMAVETARGAGLRSIMITGDHALTAQAIARDLGILGPDGAALTGSELDTLDDDQLRERLQHSSTFARVSPTHKLRLVQVLQAQGETVAMTGDGVNDAPALKQADIGIAMGITGTDVSKGAAEMVLTDDNFASIVRAVEEGRVIYDNIRKFVRYLLSCNVGEILVMFVALIIGLKIPLLAIQILWVNLVTDGLPAIALGFEPGEEDVMRRKPRARDERILAGRTGKFIPRIGVLIAILTLLSYVWGYTSLGMQPFSETLGLEDIDAGALAEFVDPGLIPADWDQLSPQERIDDWLTGSEFASEGIDEGLLASAERIPRSIAFTVLAMTQMFAVMAIHAGERLSLFRVGFRKNPLLPAAIALTALLQLLVIYLPALQPIFETAAIPPLQMLVSVVMASLVLVAIELQKLLFPAQPPEAAA
ncbi:MAG: cation-translocating P-type ATPase, partial [Anaerolineaceae bacterium]|nr:cation-translocating P-type ATPase [Anaerolineaceae bacterium]